MSKQIRYLTNLLEQWGLYSSEIVTPDTKLIQEKAVELSQGLLSFSLFKKYIDRYRAVYGFKALLDTKLLSIILQHQPGFDPMSESAQVFLYCRYLNKAALPLNLNTIIRSCNPEKTKLDYDQFFCFLAFYDIISLKHVRLSKDVPQAIKKSWHSFTTLRQNFKMPKQVLSLMRMIAQNKSPYSFMELAANNDKFRSQCAEFEYPSSINIWSYFKRLFASQDDKIRFNYLQSCAKAHGILSDAEQYQLSRASI